MSRHIEVESEINTSALGDVHAKWKVADVTISVKMDNPAQDIRERVMIAAERFSDETRRILEGEPIKNAVYAKVSETNLDALHAKFERLGELTRSMNDALSDLRKNRVTLLVELGDDEPQSVHADDESRIPIDLSANPDLDPDSPEFDYEAWEAFSDDMGRRSQARIVNERYREAGLLIGGKATDNAADNKGAKLDTES